MDLPIPVLPKERASLPMLLLSIDIVLLLCSRVGDQVCAVGLAGLLRLIEGDRPVRGEVAPPVDQRPRGVQARALYKTLASYCIKAQYKVTNAKRY